MLELVRTVVCGYMEVQTFNGARYFVTFIDDYSKKVMAIHDQNRIQVLDYFQKLHLTVKRVKVLSLKVICFDNGGEHIGTFEQYCRKHGIKHERTVMGIPPQNGLAKRMNRTICEKVQSIL